jgi:hypothetical protein
VYKDDDYGSDNEVDSKGDMSWNTGTARSDTPLQPLPLLLPNQELYQSLGYVPATPSSHPSMPMNNQMDMKFVYIIPIFIGLVYWNSLKSSVFVFLQKRVQNRTTQPLSPPLPHPLSLAEAK